MAVFKIQLPEVLESPLPGMALDLIGRSFLLPHE